MTKNGLLIQYEYCTGCHSCEVACKKEHNLPKGVFGIKVFQYGPEEYEPGKWDYLFSPMLTSSCDLCAEHVESGGIPTCVKHCQAKVMRYGDVEELACLAADMKKASLFIPNL